MHRVIKKLLCAVVCISCFCLSGCLGPEWRDEYTYCIIHSVDGGVYTYQNEYTCTNGSRIIYYDEDTIYSYQNGKSEPIIHIELDLLYNYVNLDTVDSYLISSMSCTSKYLYCYIWCFDNPKNEENEEYESETVLFQVDLETKKVESLNKVYGITSNKRPFSHNEDVFVSLEFGDAQWQFCHIDGDGNLQQLDIETGTVDMEMDSYHISGTWDAKDGTWTSLLVYAEDGWQYSGGNPLTVKLDNGILVFDKYYGTDYTFGGLQTDIYEQLLPEDAKKDNEYHPLSVPETCTVYNNEIYMLYEYVRDAHDDWEDGRDAIYKLNPNTGEVSLVYQVDAMPTRIAGYSIEKDVIYLLKFDGVYQVNLEGNQEEKLLDINSGDGTYDSRLYFEWCNGYLFVIEHDTDHVLAIL